MVAKIIYFTLVLFGSALVAQSSLTIQNEKQILVELTERLDRLQNKVETLEFEKEMLITRFDGLEMENVELRSEVKALIVQAYKQDEEVSLLKSHVTHLESLLATKRDFNYGTNQSSNENNGPSTRALGRPPSSCQEWLDTSKLILADGIYLVKNKNTNNFNQIQAVFCTFSSSNVVQEPIGTVDIKTKSVHFYVHRDSSFGPAGGVIPFQLAKLNEGYAFNLFSGIFTVPVSGIYHFQFSAVKDYSTAWLAIFLQVNGARVSLANTDQVATGSYNANCLSASLRLAAGDTVNLFNMYGGVLLDSNHHYTHFSGWLVEQDLL